MCVLFVLLRALKTPMSLAAAYCARYQVLFRTLISKIHKEEQATAAVSTT